MSFVKTSNRELLEQLRELVKAKEDHHESQPDWFQIMREIGEVEDEMLRRMGEDVPDLVSMSGEDLVALVLERHREVISKGATLHLDEYTHDQFEVARVELLRRLG